jgi:squalene-associated FAD-dependent desaturase
MTGRTIIVGGGLAGLAAAVELAQRGVPVTLLESRPRLGGRASSFVDRATGETIDNCQHVALGCCTNFRHFCDSIGAGGLLREERELFFVGRDNVVRRFAEGRLPAPLHLWPGFRALRFLSPDELRAIRSGLLRLARTDARDLRGRSFAAWLADHRQPDGAVERFWHVVLVSALSESLERIDAAHARKVFVDAFLASRQGWRVHIPTVPLDELYGERLQARLRDLGATVRPQAGVERVVVENARAAAVELRTGERIAGEQFILAVPHHLVRELLPDAWRGHPDLERIGRLESAPISSVHLWFDRPITPLPHAVFVERLSQWMFNRSGVRGQESGSREQAAGDAGGDERRTSNIECPTSNEAGRSTTDRGPRTADHPQPCYYQIVISASRHLAGRPQDQTIAAVVQELAEVWPVIHEAKLLRARMVTEHRAVFSPQPGCDEVRPAQQSPIANVQLAGDWTRTGWPATMEGAVRSGYLAAENVLTHFGRPERLVRPDLPMGWLARLFVRS